MSKNDPFLTLERNKDKSPVHINPAAEVSNYTVRNREQVRLKENAQGDLISAQPNNLGSVQFAEHCADKRVSLPAVFVISCGTIPISVSASLQTGSSGDTCETY